ncbi:MAG: hypothetical protein M3R61_00390 [Chloroflexota bacterium]|nr:hypothetical protein [Chloroflexota bacterium]
MSPCSGGWGLALPCYRRSGTVATPDRDLASPPSAASDGDPGRAGQAATRI